jgi:hypothetical protein
MLRAEAGGLQHLLCRLLFSFLLGRRKTWDGPFGIVPFFLIKTNI